MENDISKIEKAQADEGRDRKDDTKDFTTTQREVVSNLKVKSDPPDISSDDRKRNVKKLAGAISHSLRANGEISARCFGNASIGKAAKALAIARNYVETSGLQLSCSPAFITTTMGDSELTGISFCTFATKKDEENDFDFDIDKVKSVLMVKADNRDIEAEDRKSNVKKLAGAVAHSLEENKEVLQEIVNDSMNKKCDCKCNRNVIID